MHSSKYQQHARKKYLFNVVAFVNSPVRIGIDVVLSEEYTLSKKFVAKKVVNLILLDIRRSVPILMSSTLKKFISNPFTIS